MTNSSTTLNNNWKTLLGYKIDLDLFESNISYTKSKELFEKYVKIINLETFSYCNRHCSYCPVSLVEQKQNIYLDESYFNLLIKNLKDINYKNTICLNLYNEPLSDKSIYDTIYRLREALPVANLFFNSNGDYVTMSVLDKLVEAGLNSINITLHTLPNEPYNNGNSLKKIDKFYNKLNLKYTIDSQKENQYIKTSFKYKNLSIYVSTTNYNEYGESRAGSIDNLVEEVKRSWPCARPYREFTIFSNGEAYPCCQIYAPLDSGKNSMGSIKNYDSIFELYTSYKLSKLRKHLYGYGIKKSPCDTCTEPFLHKDRNKLV